jgi:hypothetical protein
VTALDHLFLAVTVAGVLVGVWAICWARGSTDPARVAWGRRLCVLTLLGLGAGGLAAAGCRADALAPLGLSAGLLVVGMVGDLPLAGPSARPEDEA